MAFLLWLTENFSFLLALLAQGVSLMLPLQLRTWKEDIIHVLTYATIQVFVSIVMFVWIPSVFDLYKLTLGTEFLLTVIVFVLAWMRALNIIPLEFTYPVIPDITKIEGLRFVEFTAPDRIKLLSEINQADPLSAQKIAAIKEKLGKRRPDKIAMKGQSENVSSGTPAEVGGGTSA